MKENTHASDISPEAKSAEWLLAIRNLARGAGCEQAIELPLERISSLGRDTISVAIIGSPNAGKSSLINGLLGRSILPVSSLPSHVTFEVNGISPGEHEQFVVAGAVRPLDQLSSALKSAAGNPFHVGVKVDNEWIRDTCLRLSEKEALDADDENMIHVIDACLWDVDIVVLMIDALMPVKRADAMLLAECARRRLPVIVALSKSDKLSLEERESVVPYVEKQVRRHLLEAQIIEFNSDSMNSPYGVESLKEAIMAVVKGADLSQVRFEQVKGDLLRTLELISNAASVGKEAEAKSLKERETEITERRNQIDAQNLIWMQIEQQLNERRHKVEDQIRTHLAVNQSEILDGLYYDLEKSNDIKTWWQRDLGYRLQRELRTQAARISASIDRQLASDRKWLQEELHRRFKYPLTVGPEVEITIRDIFVDTPNIPLSDTQKLKIISRLGTASVVIAAGTLFATAGIGGAVLATSLLAGLAAEQWNTHQTTKNREKVRSELDVLIGRAAVRYASEVSSILKTWYDNVIGHVREHQSQWQMAQLQALQATKERRETPGRSDWKDILRETDRLRQEIQPQTTAQERKQEGETSQ